MRRYNHFTKHNLRWSAAHWAMRENCFIQTSSERISKNCIRTYYLHNLGSNSRDTPLTVFVFSTPLQQTTITFIISGKKGTTIRLVYLSRRMASLPLTWNLLSSASTPMIKAPRRVLAASIRLILRDEDLKCGSKPKPSKHSDMHAHNALYTVFPITWNWYSKHLNYHCCCELLRRSRLNYKLHRCNSTRKVM